MWVRGVVCRAFDHAGYAEFRDCSLKDAAMEFASSGLTEAVKKLLQRHPYALMPHVLEILSCFPETLIPKSYIGILPKACSPWPLLRLRMFYTFLHESLETLLGC